MADSTQEDLLAHYCPPLDSALVLAVLADHVDDPSSARETLDALLTSIPNDAEEDSQTTESTGSEIERALTEWSLDDAASKESFDSASLDDPLLFLVSVFPKRARAELEDSLAEQGGDVERTVEDILSQDFIKHQTELDVAAALDGARDGLTTPIHRKAKRRQLKQANTISLTDVMHRQSSTTGSDSESDWADANSTGNIWVSLDSTATYLADLLSLPVGSLTSAYHRADSNWAAAVEVLLDGLEHSRPFEALPGHAELLIAAMTQIEVATEARRLLSGTSGDLAAALDLNAWRAGRVTARTRGVVASGPDAMRRAAVLHAGSTLAPASPLPIRSVSPVRNGPPSRPASSASSIDIPPPSSDASHADCIAIATEYREKRDEAYRQAARHFALADRPTRAAASYWADLARDYEGKARAWELRAARALVKRRQAAVEGREVTTTVDLHNLTVSQALTVSKESVNSWWASAPHPLPLRVVTGAGTHSSHGRPVIGPAVAKMLEREGWQFKRDGAGVLIVTGLGRGRR